MPATMTSSDVPEVLASPAAVRKFGRALGEEGAERMFAAVERLQAEAESMLAELDKE